MAEHGLRMVAGGRADERAAEPATPRLEPVPQMRIAV
jgi:hypothetical protein